MSARGTRATDVLRAAGVAFTLHEYDRDELDPKAHGSYGETTAIALGVEADRLFKTLVATVEGGPFGAGSLAVGVVPVSGELDLKRLAEALGGRKAAMADPAAAERATGYVVGGISPLGQRRSLPTVVDETVELFETVYVSGGRRALQVELAPGDLIRLTGAVTAPIART